MENQNNKKLSKLGFKPKWNKEGMSEEIKFHLLDGLLQEHDENGKCKYYRIKEGKWKEVKIEVKMMMKMKMMNNKTINTKGEITKSQFLNYLKVQESGKFNMFGYDKDIQRGNNYEKAYEWFIDKKQDTSLTINITTGLVVEGRIK